MKTNTKIELGILAFAAILSLIFQVYIKSVSNRTQAKEIELQGELITKDFPIQAFSIIDSDINFKVDYYVGEPRVEVTTDEGAMDQIIIEQEGTVLNISNDDALNRSNGQLRRISTIKIYNNQALEFIRTGHNSSLNLIESKLASSLKIRTRGNSTLSGSIVIDSVQIESDGNSSVSFDGIATFGNIESSGNSHYNLDDLEFAELEIYSHGNSQGQAKVIESIKVHANGNSRVVILGDPTKTRVNSSGNAHINIKD